MITHPKYHCKSSKRFIGLCMKFHLLIGKAIGLFIYIYISLSLSHFPFSLHTKEQKPAAHAIAQESSWQRQLLSAQMPKRSGPWACPHCPGDWWDPQTTNLSFLQHSIDFKKPSSHLGCISWASQSKRQLLHLNHITQINWVERHS